MKKTIVALWLFALISYGCGSTYQTTSVLAGAAIGGNVGGAIGGLAGSNRHWDGGFRGSAIGTIVGTVAGAAIGGAISSAQENNTQDYVVEERRRYVPAPEVEPALETELSPIGYLQIRNIRFIDDNRDHIIQPLENSKVIFEIINTCDQTVCNAVPIVQTDNEQIYVSPSVMIEQIAPHNGIKYTAHLKGGKRLKNGETIIHIAVADDRGTEYDWQEFKLRTGR